MGKAKADTGAGGLIGGVQVARVNAEHLREVLTEAGVKKLTADLSVETLVTLANRHYALLPDDQLGTCDECGGKSDMNLPSCAFCAAGDEEEDDADSESAGSGSDSEDSGSPGDDDEGEEEEDDEEEDEEESESDEERTPMTTTVTAAPKATAIVKAPKADLVPASQVVTEETLDKQVAEVRQLKGEAAESYWKLGTAIRAIYDERTWVQRKGDDGKKGARWKTFDAFCHHELGMSHTHAKSLMDVSLAYTEEQVRAFGTAKLGLVLQAPVEDQPRLQASVERGTSKKELEAEVRKIKQEKGHVRPSRDGSPQRPRVESTPREEKITVASILGKTLVKLYKKPAEKKFEEKDLKRAKKLGDVPFGFHDLENGVRETFTVTENAAGELELKIERKRDA